MMERNLKLDYFKLILSILVITIHMQPLYEVAPICDWLISNGIARIAVPSFFLMAGYFVSAKIVDRGYILKYLRHLIIVYVVWSLIYLPTYIQEVETLSIIRFALMGYYHLWFLPALITGVVLLIIACKYIKKESILIAVAILLYAAGFVMEHLEYSYYTFCNGLFFAFPFLVFGYCIQKKRPLKNAPSYIIWLILAISITALLVEAYINYRMQAYINLLASALVVCPILFICIIRNSEIRMASNSIAKLSAGVYYVHIMVITFAIQLVDANNISIFSFVVAISILISTFIVIINKRIKILL